MPSSVSQFFQNSTVQFAEGVISFAIFRYVLLAGGMFFVLYIWQHTFFAKHKIQPKETTNDKVKWEITTGVKSIFIYAGVLVLVEILGEYGINQVYFQLDKLGIVWAIASFFLLFIFHETYFYWTHRLIHRPQLMHKIHKVHHVSNNITPFAAVAVHPVEALVEYSYLLVFSFIFPVSIYVLLAESLIAFFFNLLWHSGYEFFPKGWVTHPFFGWFNTSTHHNLHHQRPVGNYGLYTNFWDRMCNTNRKEYASYFNEVKGRLEKE